MKDLITQALSMHDDPPLCLRPEHVILPVILRRVLLLSPHDLLVILVVDFGNHLKRLQPACLLDSDDAPVVEAALPELAEVNGYLSLEVLGRDYVALVYLVPGQDRLVLALDRRRGVQTDEELRVLLLLQVVVHYDVHLEVLTHYSHHWLKG